ncbi:MAG: endolytic transglycosylase MltG [Bacteroidales bacterium]|nr:endolytic transglycosylase MltG [Bacteroidales bacterium]
MEYYHSAYSRPSKKKNKLGIFFRIILFVVVLGLAGGAYFIYQAIFSPNVWVSDEKEEFTIYIKPTDTFADLKTQLYNNGLIIHRANFEWWAKQKKYDQHIKPGMYLLTNGLSNEDLINMLRSGEQEPVRLIFNNVRLKKDLANKISTQLNVDSTKLLRMLNDSIVAAKYGFSTETFATMFIPNTYFVNWNTSAEKFIERMNYEYRQFWNDSRRNKAIALGLSPVEVSILASIVEKETQQNAEKAKVAGVYINRLKRGWRLQADPTLIYALGDFTIKRVLKEYLNINSPYNTYRYAGLPPGPICIPSISSIDAVLNAENHSFLYFCAKPDYSGYHNFAKNNTMHNINAQAYRNFLNKERIFK